jgi:protein-S-isoprenylcysteine O-methyltransferase Ste14
VDRALSAMLRPLSLFGYVAMVAAIVGLFLSHALFSPSPLVIVPQALAVALMLWARVTFGRRSFHATAGATGGGLVTSGPYRFVRHPIYTAVCLFGWAGVLAHWSWRSAALGILLLAGALTRMLCEERLVAERYPEYPAYARRTRRMIPGVF